MITSLALALLSGVLSTLSPCVLPLLPIILIAATAQHRLGPFALAGGLALSYVVIGLFVATVGFSIGLHGEILRRIAAGVLLALGLILLVPSLQARVALAAGPLGNWADARIGNNFGAAGGSGLKGQFAIGALLGVVWTPCVGPTLGAALLLASQSENLLASGAIMLVFGIGAALPLVVLGLVSQQTMLRWRGRLQHTSHHLKIALGIAFVAMALAILSGFDRVIETALVDASPRWLTELTTKF